MLEEQVDLISKRGFKALTATTAEDALLLHKKEAADAIIAELDIPNMGGDRLCDIIREDKDAKKVYFGIVCAGRKSDLERCGRCGADSMIKTPVDTMALADRISRVLDVPNRRAFRVLVKVTVLGKYKSEPFFCTSENISITGMKMETDKALAKGDLISCSFFLPDADRVEVDGEIVRIERAENNAHCYGVNFIRIENGNKAVIDDFVNKERLQGNF